MIVVSRNEHKLVLAGIGSGIFLIFLGLIFIVAGFAAGESTTLTCVRDAMPPCQIQHKLYGIPTRATPLDSLTGAYVEETINNEEGAVYRIILTTLHGEVPLTRTYSSGYEDKFRLAREINALVDINTPYTFKISQTSGLNTLLSIIAVLAGGGGMLLGLQTTSCTWTFDRTQGLLIQRSWGWKGPRSKEYALRDITGVWVAEQRSDDDSVYRIELSMGNGKVLPLTNFYSSGQGRKQRVVDTILKFLNYSDY